MSRLLATLLCLFGILSIDNGQLLTLRQAAEQHPKGFTFGVAINSLELQQTTDTEYGEYAYTQFNTLTSMAYCKWGAIQPNNRFEYDWTGCDYIYNFAITHNLRMTFHTLVWDTYTPYWLMNDGYTADELKVILKEFITAVLTRYTHPLVYSWDIVNEAILDVQESNGNWYRHQYFYHVLPNYIELSFEYAKEALDSINSNIKLFYNEFNIILTSEWMDPKTEAVYSLMSNLVNNGVAIDGIGFQCHLYLDHYNDIMSSWDIVIANLQRFADLGLEIHISEVDVDCGYWDDNTKQRMPCDTWTTTEETQQAQVYQFLLEACIAIDACKSYELWGFTDKYTWLDGHHPLPFDENYQAKLAAYYLLETMAPGATLNYGVTLPPSTPTISWPTVANSPSSSPSSPTTSIPTTTPQPAVSPVNPPTAQPITNNNGNTIMIRNHEGNNLWWMAIYIEDITNGYTITKVEIKDNVYDWLEGVHTFWGNLDPYVFASPWGNEWTLPMDVRITANNGNGDVVLESSDVVTSVTEGDVFDFTQNF